jgi:hypothetical protein
VARGPPARTRGGRLANLIRLRYSLWTEQPLYNRRTFEPLWRRSVVLVTLCYRTALPWPIIVRARRRICGPWSRMTHYLVHVHEPTRAIDVPPPKQVLLSRHETIPSVMIAGSSHRCIPPFYRSIACKQLLMAPFTRADYLGHYANYTYYRTKVSIARI